MEEDIKTIGTSAKPNLATDFEVQDSSAVAPPGGCTEDVA